MLVELKDLKQTIARAIAHFRAININPSHIKSTNKSVYVLYDKTTMCYCAEFESGRNHTVEVLDIKFIPKYLSTEDLEAYFINRIMPEIKKYLTKIK
jgi:hypothetical protein